MTGWHLTTLWLLMHLKRLFIPSLLKQRNPGYNNKAKHNDKPFLLLVVGLSLFLPYIENQVYSVFLCEMKYRINIY